MADKTFLLKNAISDERGFRFPNIDSLDYKSDSFGFGSDTDSGNALSHNQMADNMALPFVESYGKTITEDTTITDLDHDVKLVVSAGISVTLSATPNAGTKVAFIPAFISGTSENTNLRATIVASGTTYYLLGNNVITLVYNGQSWKQTNYSDKYNLKLMTPSCYMGRDLRKVLFDLGEISGVSSYTKVTRTQIVNALSARCTRSYSDRNERFAGLALGDYFWLGSSGSDLADGGGSLTLSSLSGVTNPDDTDTSLTWGSNGTYFTAGQTGNMTISSGYTKVVICGFDTYYRTGSIDNSKHHITFQFESVLCRSLMNNTDTGTGGFPSSCLHQFLNGTTGGVYKMISDIIGTSHIMSTNHPYRTVYNTDTASWVSDYVFLPSVTEVFGYPARVYDTHCWGDSFPQWPIFAACPEKRLKFYQGSRWWWWLGSLAYTASSNFVGCSTHGHANLTGAANYDGGVCAAFNLS